MLFWPFFLQFFFIGLIACIVGIIIVFIVNKSFTL